MVEDVLIKYKLEIVNSLIAKTRFDWAALSKCCFFITAFTKKPDAVDVQAVRGS